nr:MAG TPA: hypothetical protein [Bacteriophage sp.]
MLKVTKKLNWNAWHNNLNNNMRGLVPRYFYL